MEIFVFQRKLQTQFFVTYNITNIKQGGLDYGMGKIRRRQL